MWTSWTMYTCVWLYIMMAMCIMRWYFFTSFVVLADSENVDRDVTVTSVDGISCVDDTCGKVFVLVLSYNMTYDVLEMATVWVKTTCRWSLSDDFYKWFLMLFTNRNCVYICQYVL